MLKRILWIVLFIGLIAPNVSAQSALQVDKNTATPKYPKTVTFELVAKSAATVSEAYLLYGTNLRSCAASSARQALQISSGDSQTIQWTWNLEKSNNLPPGAQIWWQWELHDESGNITLTDKKSLTIEDPDHPWKKLNKGNVTVYWYKGKDSFGQFLLDTAVNSIERLSRKAGVRTAGEIRLMIYPDTESMLKAALHIPGWAGGVTFPEYNSILIAIPPNATYWASLVIPHELAHLTTQERIFNCMGIDIPTWLSEGLSGYAEGDVSRQDLSTIKKAFKDDDVPSLRDLARGFYGERERINISYIASHMVVSYLVEKYGPEKMASLLASVRSGDNIDKALIEVYGFDTDGLDLEWRISIGAIKTTPTPIPANQSATAQNTPVPTLALWTPAYQPSASTTTPAP